MRIDGKACSHEDIAVLVGRSVREIAPLIAELEERRVFSRTRDGTIYNRRLVRDEKNRKFFQKKGKEGGNPALLPSDGNKTKKSSTLNPSDNPSVNGADNGPHARARPLAHSPIPFKSPSQPALGVSELSARDLGGLAGLAELKIKEEWIIEAYDKREAQGMPYVDLKYEATKLTERWSNNPPDNPHAAWIGFAMKARAKQTNGAAGQDKYGYDIPPRGKRDSPKGPPPPLPKPH